MDRGGRQQLSFSGFFQETEYGAHTAAIGEYMTSLSKFHMFVFTYYDQLTRGSVDVYLSVTVSSISKHYLVLNIVWGQNLDLIGTSCQRFHEQFPSAKMRAEYTGTRTHWWSWLTRIILWSRKLKAMDNKEYFVHQLVMQNFKQLNSLVFFTLCMFENLQEWEVRVTGKQGKTKAHEKIWRVSCKTQQKQPPDCHFGANCELMPGVSSFLYEVLQCEQ